MTDRWLQPISAAMDTLGFGGLGGDPTLTMSGIQGGKRLGDPTQGFANYQGGFGGFDPLMDAALPAWGAQLDKQNQQYSGMGQSSGGYSGWGGPASAAGGQWALLDQLNPSLAQMQHELGVPANLVKGILAREGSFGRDFYTVNARGEQILAFNGIFQSTAASHGIDWNRMISDKGYAAYAVGKVLRNLYDQQGGAYGWEGAAKTYFGGSPTANFQDEQGNTTQDYMYGPNGVITHWKNLDALSGGGAGSMLSSAGGWGGSGGGAGSLNAIWGNTQAPMTFEFHGRGGPDLYGYGTSYGLNGAEHTGIDVGLALNSPLYAPMSGTVTCAGTNNGPGTAGGGCSAFNDVMGSGAGRIELQLDNGAVIILGHSSQSTVQPGQRVTAGQMVGRSGGMNGAHVHIEARIPNASMPSGWQIVDPRQVLGAGTFGGGFAGSYSAAGPANGGMAPWYSSPGAFWQNLASGGSWG